MCGDFIINNFSWLSLVMVLNHLTLILFFIYIFRLQEKQESVQQQYRALQFYKPPNTALCLKQRIIDDRIEKYDAYVVVFSKQDCCNEECLSRQEIDTKGGWSVGADGPVQQPDCVGGESRGRGAGPGRLCRIRRPFILFSILSSINLWF